MLLTILPRAVLGNCLDDDLAIGKPPHSGRLGDHSSLLSVLLGRMLGDGLRLLDFRRPLENEISRVVITVALDFAGHVVAILTVDFVLVISSQPGELFLADEAPESG